MFGEVVSGWNQTHSNQRRKTTNERFVLLFVYFNVILAFRLRMASGLRRIYIYVRTSYSTTCSNSRYFYNYLAHISFLDLSTTPLLFFPRIIFSVTFLATLCLPLFWCSPLFFLPSFAHTSLLTPSQTGNSSDLFLDRWIFAESFVIE